MRNTLIAVAVIAAGVARADMLAQFWARSAVASAVSVNIASGMQHYWNPGVGGATDLVSGAVATLAGGVTSTSNGWDMGTDDGKYVSLPHRITNGTSYAISVWCYPDKTAMDANATGGWILSDRTASAGKDDFQLEYIKGSVWGFAAFNSADAAVSVSVSNVVNASWTHIVAVADASAFALRLFTNGVLASTNLLSITPNNGSTVAATIGIQSWGGGPSGTKWHGVLDKIRFYTNAISASVVSEIYITEKAQKGL